MMNENFYLNLLEQSPLLILLWKSEGKNLGQVIKRTLTASDDTKKEVIRGIHINRGSTSMRQSAEWCMNAYILELKDWSADEERGERRIL